VKRRKREQKLREGRGEARRGERREGRVGVAGGGWKVEGHESGRHYLVYNVGFRDSIFFDKAMFAALDGYLYFRDRHWFYLFFLLLDEGWGCAW